ncbi:hypothetical protein [Hydrogenophaga palleronii]|uniref:hypothetical protein n=1 Tax=Hydrogenophaga palleronii TaxID=65655 RepID=UPI0008265ED6|nr:hypothetical protein [Hydrogenophaga palleronii]
MRASTTARPQPADALMDAAKPRRAGVATLALLLLAPWLCHAQAQEQAPGDGAAACIEVEVDGQRSPPSFECLTQRLAPAGQGARSSQAAPRLASEAIVLRPSNQLGLFNRAATGHRMGNQFGISAFPQRPGDAPERTPIPAVPRP